MTEPKIPRAKPHVHKQNKTKQETVDEKHTKELAERTTKNIMRIINDSRKGTHACARYGKHLPHPNPRNEGCIRCGEPLDSEIPKLS